MDPAHVVLLLAVFIAVAAIAGYLIVITLILRHVVARLVTILGAVQAVTDTAQPVGPILEDISKELDAGRRVMEDSVQRLEESRAPVGATAEPGRHEKIRSGSEGGDAGTAVAAPPPTSGAPPPASTIPSPTHPSPPPGSPGAEDEDPGRQPPPERKRSWWTR